MTEKTSYGIRIAKASSVELDRVHAFLAELDEMLDGFTDVTDYVAEQLEEITPSMKRILIGYDTLVSSLCDPDASYLKLKSQWIPVAERKPEKNSNGESESVLVRIYIPALEESDMGVARLCPDGRWRGLNWEQLVDHERVTHWMPLPAMPGTEE